MIFRKNGRDDQQSLALNRQLRHEPEKYHLQPVLRYLDDTSETARLREYIWKYSYSIPWSIWTHKILTCGILMAFRSDNSFSLNDLGTATFMDSDTKLDPFVEPVPASLVQDKTVDDPTSTSEHLDAWELTNRQIWLWNFWQNHGFGGCSLNLRTICVEFCFLNFWKLLFC
ncbi:hypothetical protein RCL_jg22596.t1 [Rhizophagus clarus]|uniref:Uncharacterized protein n=1 Tax=Rhizophagus clarus TaxID=94130 RepID=A0A8H3R5H1_9GLOM|nr:hypothetical protein RCL_jg22596.t1 [Rhizophagus clarus]